MYLALARAEMRVGVVRSRIYVMGRILRMGGCVEVVVRIGIWGIFGFRTIEMPCRVGEAVTV